LYTKNDSELSWHEHLFLRIIYLLYQVLGFFNDIFLNINIVLLCAILNRDVKKII